MRHSTEETVCLAEVHPVRLNIEIHENVIDSTNYHAKHSYR